MSTLLPSLANTPAERPARTFDSEQALAKLRAGAATTGKADPQPDPTALDVARRFEALLVHNMLKAMRTTTLAESKSNATAMYEDMFDERIADAVSAGEGIGLATQIVGQLSASPAARRENTLNAAELARLRALVPDNTTVSTTSTQVNRNKADLPGSGGIQAAAGTDGNSNARWLDELYASRVKPPEGIRSERNVKRTFITKMRHLAEHSARQIGTSALPVLAVAALESGWGRRVATDADGTSSHNLFGIKATRTSEPALFARTTEYNDGEYRHVQAWFRRYPNNAAAMDDFAAFLKRNPRYRSALMHADDAERFIRELHRAGYATDPHYADKLIDVMQQIEALAPELQRAPLS